MEQIKKIGLASPFLYSMQSSTAMMKLGLMLYFLIT